MWGEKCKATAVDKENCALQCLSPVCFEHVYQSDPVRIINLNILLVYWDVYAYVHNAEYLYWCVLN